MAAEAGQLQLNAFEPIIAHSLFKSLTHLDAASRSLIEKCVVGITANAERLYESVVNSIGVVTALNPFIGYAAGARIAKLALASHAGPGAGGRAETVVPQPGNRAVATRIIRRSEAISDGNSHTRIEGFA